MTSILKAKEEDIQLLTDIGKKTFIESHGHSAAEADINLYISKTYTPDVFKEELSDPKNIYHIIYYNQQPAGFSKIIFNSPHSNIKEENITKLERIYLLKEFYSLKLGAELLKYNIELSKQNKQAGMWLFVWKENPRAVNFYTKAGFEIIGSYDFKLTETHSNPNHQMFLKY
jgi:ribosomal protein S18 acetylase RimI-like enzyme